MTTAEQNCINNRILYCRTGSQLYGTNTLTSDEDFYGVYIPTREVIFGLNPFDRVDASVKSVGENGKNDAKAVDIKYDDIRKFVKQVLAGSPNFVEILFVNDKNIVDITPAGRKLMENADVLLGKQNIYNRFRKYMESQKRSMFVKSTSIPKLMAAYDFIENQEPGTRLDDIAANVPYLVIKNNLYSVTDTNLQFGITCGTAKSILAKRIGAASYRINYIKEYGYDHKSANNVVRLILEGAELLATGKIEFPLQYSDVIFDVKSGKLTLNELEYLISKIEPDLHAAYDKSMLPDVADVQLAESILIDIIEDNVIQLHT